MTTKPWIIAVGGVDPTGGAGLVRDAVTAGERGAEVYLVGTAWTRQSAAGVAAIEPREPAAVATALGDGLRIAASGGRAVAVKIGMIATPALAAAVAERLAGFSGPVVFDPVLVASAGGALFLGPENIAGALGPLIRAATLLTPNASEAARLTGHTVTTAMDAERAGHDLIKQGARAVLVKGGHLGDREAIDVLVTAAGIERFALPRHPGPSPRGTGCALASAIAIELARGGSLPVAIRIAKAWLAERIARASVIGGTAGV